MRISERILIMGDATKENECTVLVTGFGVGGLDHYFAPAADDRSAIPRPVSREPIL